MKLLKNEKGYGLVLTLLVATVLTVVGLTIVAATIQGTKRTTIREVDINVSAQAKTAMEEMISDLKFNLQSPNSTYLIPLEKNADGTISNFFYSTLSNMIDKTVIKAYETKPFLEEVTVNDVTTDFLPSSTLNKHFTRIYEISLVTKPPENKNVPKIERTFTKRVILSPTPSFLQYALGSASKLILNGSPTVYGDVFAKDLKIDADANYTPTTRVDEQQIKTPLPRITGDLYSPTVNLFKNLNDDPLKFNGNPATMFYNGDVPTLKNDSDFIDFDFEQAMNQEEQLILKEANGGTPPKQTLNQFLNATIQSVSANGILITEDILERVFNILSIGDLVGNLLNNSISTSDYLSIPSLKNLLSEGTNLVFDTVGTTATGIHISNITASTLESITVKGDLVLDNISDLTIQKGLFVDGDVFITNFANSNLDVSKIMATGDITILNPKNATLNLTGHIIGGKNVLIETTQDLEISHAMIAGEDLVLKPIDSTLTLTKNVIVKNDFVIQGKNDTKGTENDNAIFDSIVYTLGKVNITNVNIGGIQKGKEEGMLILLAKDDINLNRINEFRILSQTDDQVDLRKIDAFSPLTGFFYTEGNATLYGVGSLFAIDGGIFAKGPLTINAIRGNVNDENELNQLSKSVSVTSQQGKYSRFNILYNKSVLLSKLDSLPIVNKLQVIPEPTIQP
ncbi:hypothetical protein [Metabacillus iocasae]|uniref:Type II secretion system protein n=1 Tax=Priestia iocasae TaxID=2291674 RepID=A0ABS2QQN6_9BACI|nr:hypothetical protein [Metabacillus iocasae]MBM7701347.1 hypothetical protein [Metabacillus iocasae]